MAHYSEDVKNKVRQQYVFAKLSLASVALVVDVPYQTVCRWKKQAKDKGDDWDKVKAAHAMVGGDTEDFSRQLMDEFKVQYKSTMDSIKETVGMPAGDKVTLLASLADSFIKVVSANKKLMPETTKLAVALEVIKMLGEYIGEHKPDLLMPFMEVLEPFGEHVERELK